MCKGHRPGPSRVHTVKTESCRIGNMCTAQLVVVFAILLVLLGLGRRSVTPNPRPANDTTNLDFARSESGKMSTIGKISKFTWSR